MKRPVIAIILLVAAVAIGITSLICIERSCDKMIASLDEILENAVAENTEEVNRLSALANSQWEKEKSLLNILIGLQDTNDVKTNMHKIAYYAELGDLPSVILYGEECRVTLLRIKASVEPNISTIL